MAQARSPRTPLALPIRLTQHDVMVLLRAAKLDVDASSLVDAEQLTTLLETLANVDDEELRRIEPMPHVDVSAPSPSRLT